MSGQVLNLAKDPESMFQCPDHAGRRRIPCKPHTCVSMGEARILEDRVLAIETLVEAARDAVLEKATETVAAGLPITAALEAARVLAQSITFGDEFLVPGQDRVRWGVLKLTASEGEGR